MTPDDERKQRKRIAAMKRVTYEESHSDIDLDDTYQDPNFVEAENPDSPDSEYEYEQSSNPGIRRERPVPRIPRQLSKWDSIWRLFFGNY